MIELNNNYSYDDIVKLRQRFCKDNKIQIKLFVSPFFESRLKLFDAEEEYDNFLKEVDRFNNVEEYFSYYNSVKDEAINYIKSSEAFIKLNEEDFSKLKPKKRYSSGMIYKPSNVGNKYISIDMVKANFSALVTYSLQNGYNFFSSYNYEDFISTFTDMNHIKNSKYIRQVIFGNCNPKRVINYESVLMYSLLDLLFENNLVADSDVVAVLADEIVLNADNVDESKLIEHLEMFSNTDFPVLIKSFQLGKITGSDAYIRKFSDDDYDLKCLNPDEAPFIIRMMNCERYDDYDFIFVYNNKLAKFLDCPKYDITYKKQ